jgi:uncharacterized protein YndB with AHSA1/START domain
MKEHTAGETLTITRTFAAPRDLVFQTWTTAEMAKSWWGCNQFPASFMEMDARPGGRWRGCLRSDDGKEIWLGGEFLEVIRPERLVFTFVREPAPELGLEPVDTRITITLNEDNGKTVMHFTQQFFETVELRDSHHVGWSTGFARLDQLFTQLLLNLTP